MNLMTWSILGIVLIGLCYGTFIFYCHAFTRTERFKLALSTVFVAGMLVVVVAFHSQLIRALAVLAVFGVSFYMMIYSAKAEKISERYPNDPAQIKLTTFYFVLYLNEKHVIHLTSEEKQELNDYTNKFPTEQAEYADEMAYTELRKCNQADFEKWSKGFNFNAFLNSYRKDNR